jgi:hypothetical protein
MPIRAVFSMIYPGTEMSEAGALTLLPCCLTHMHRDRADRIAQVSAFGNGGWQLFLI